SASTIESVMLLPVMVIQPKLYTVSASPGPCTSNDSAQVVVISLGTKSYVYSPIPSPSYTSAGLLFTTTIVSFCELNVHVIIPSSKSWSTPPNPPLTLISFHVPASS